MAKKVDNTTPEPAGALTLGVMCRRRHEYKATGLSVRRSDGHCAVCQRLAARARYRANPVIENARAIERRRRNIDRYRLKEARGRDRNRETLRARDRDLKRRRRREGETRPYHREYYKRNSIKIRLRTRLYKAFRAYSQGGKVKRADEYGVDYLAIMTHLGPCPGSGDWHIDHVRPLASFDFDDPKQVVEAFAPSNHQWLPAQENREKHDKWVVSA